MKIASSKLNPRAVPFNPQRRYSLRSGDNTPSAPANTPRESPVRSITPANSIVSDVADAGSSPRDSGRMTPYSPCLTNVKSEEFLAPNMEDRNFGQFSPETQPPNDNFNDEAYWYATSPNQNSPASPENAPQNESIPPPNPLVVEFATIVAEMVNVNFARLHGHMETRFQRIEEQLGSIRNEIRRNDQRMENFQQITPYIPRCSFCRTRRASYISISCGSGCMLCQFCSTRTDNIPLRRSQCPCCCIPTAWVVIRSDVHPSTFSNN